MWIHKKYMLFLIAFFVFVVGVTILGIIRIIKKDSFNKATRIIVAIADLVIVAVSWILNLGWVRFVMMILLIPFVHGIIFLLTNLFISKYADTSKKIRVLNLLFGITFLLTYIFLPDGDDKGTMYFFFGQIQDKLLLGTAQTISIIAFLGHIVSFVLQVIYAVQINNQNQQNSI